MRIALDAMGSDECPGPDVAGAVLAAREWRDDTILLVGDQTKIKQELDKHETAGLKIEIVHAEEAITMEDKPGVCWKDKPRSSMHIGMELVKQGQADGFATAGNTGAAMAVALLATLKRIRGVKRPALTAIAPLGDKLVVLLDVGANADTKPEWLAQYALMGKIYAQNALGLTNPRVGLLSIGEEEEKGSELVQSAIALIEPLPLNFVGNVEPKDIMKGSADVVVTDGFTGNVFIKTGEASLSLLANLIRGELKSNVLSTIGGLLVRPAFRRVFKRLDPFEVGGAPLLGVNGVVIIGHGRSNANAIKNAVRQVRAAVNGRVVESIREGLQAIPD